MAEDLRLAIARLGGRAEPRRRTARFPRAIFDEAGGMLPLGTLMLQTDLRKGQSGGFRSSVTLPIKSGTGSYSGDVARTTSTFALGRGQN